MALTIHLHIENGELVTCIEGGTGEIRTPFQALPSIESLQADPFRHGQALTRALGGEADLLARLSVDAHNLLLLDCDEAADTIAWEFATCTDGQFLCIKTGLLRTVERDAPPLSGDGMLNFVALAADPLVDADGNPREGYRLDLDNELRAIRVTLQACGKNLEARRIPPTRQALNKALRQGPAVLHLTCHGNVVKTKSGPLAVLSLEKEDGSMDPLTGPDLLTMPPRGVLRMVLLSACMTATGTQANLARALALSGVPLTVGMQNPFPDALSDDLAVALYDYLFAGMPFGEALRQARQNLAQHPQSVGLPVGYVARNGWEAPLPLRAGTPAVGKLTKPGFAALGGEIQPPRPLLGRNRELHQLARLYADGQKVVTVVGTGGMGKTALAAAFAERFAWRWSQGVWAYSFANEVNSIGFTNALLAALFGPETARQMADWPPLQKRAAVLEAAKNWDGLWLLDNYESVMQGLAAQQSEAEQIHRLVSDLANGDTALLLTSREQPAGLRNERLFPQNAALRGLGEAAGAELFLQHSVKAKAAPREHAEFAREIQRAADGHPLAIALLAGEFDLRAVNQADFLGNWEDELADARRAGLADHHVTFLTAFERSFSHLPHDYQRALAALSIFTFPFLAEGAKQIWENLSLFAGTDPKEMPLQALHELTRRSLLEVEGTFTDNSPATWRFQPALRQEASRRMAEADRENQLAGYAAYGDWLAQRAYGEINSDLGLNRLVRLSMEALEQATVRLEGAGRLWHIRRLAWLKNAWGETQAAFDLLVGALSIRLPDVTTEQENARIQSAIRFELAGVYNTRGELDRALALYQESLALDEQLGDKKGKAASLHQMAQVYLTRGELDRALALYQESLALKEQLGDKKGKAASLHAMAQVYLTRGELDRALALYQESLALLEQLGDKQGKAASLHQMAQVYLTRGELDRALALYQESLALLEQLGDKKGKAASLHAMAQVYLTRGELDRALALYQESLALKEQLGDKQGKAASLHQMAQVYLTRGELDRALALYQESLALDEQLGDKKGKAASLHQMAQVYLTRGELDRALALYQESLALDEQLGDKKGKAASLANMAQVYLTRGELDRALALYQESLALLEQLGDKKGKAASLGGVANLYMQKGEWDQAVKCLDEALILARALQAIGLVAFNTVKLGQVAQARGDIETASARYREGFAIFERLGMPEARQVQEMLARLEGGPASADAGRPLRAEDPQLQAVQQARAAHQRGELDSAIQHQEQAVSLARQTGPARDALVKLSIQLFNLAGYYAQADRHAEAVFALEEVVALDEQTNHPDLESDRQTLQTAREIASLSPEESTRLRQAASAAQNPNPAPSDFEAQLQAALAQVPPQERAAAEAQMRQALEEFQRLSPEQQAALADAALRQRYEQAADQARLAALAYVRRQAPKRDVVNWLEHSAEQAAEGEAPGSPWLEVAALCLALAALIKGEPIPQVPVQYAAHFSAVQTEFNSR